jgi:hypothetical protein
MLAFSLLFFTPQIYTQTHTYVKGIIPVKKNIAFLQCRKFRAAQRELTQKQQEVYVPLTHPASEAQVDFGHALVKVNGRLRTGFTGEIVRKNERGIAEGLMNWRRPASRTIYRCCLIARGIPNPRLHR